MTDLILTWIAGKEFCEHPGVTIFLNSIKRCGFDGDVVVFTHDMPDSFRSKCNYRIIDIPKEQVGVIITDRSIHYWKFLLQNNYRNVFQVDSKDVIFQLNPSECFQETGKVCFVSEGMTHKESTWNDLEQYKFQKHLLPWYKEDWKLWTVLNGGTIIGDAKILAEFNLLLWNSVCRSPFLQSDDLEIPCFTDQAALNYLYHRFLYKDLRFKVFENTFCLTGEAVAQGLVYPKPFLEDNLVKNSNGTFCMLHQWERMKSKDLIAKIYG